jgi:branched-chain amino acid transport system permease protein
VVGPITFAVSSVGAAIALKGFVALAFGGFGSIVGGLVGGLATGLIEAFATRWIAANYGGLIVFGMLLLVLMIKPTGLFGERQERMV